MFTLLNFRLDFSIVDILYKLFLQWVWGRDRQSWFMRSFGSKYMRIHDFKVHNVHLCNYLLWLMINSFQKCLNNLTDVSNKSYDLWFGNPNFLFLTFTQWTQFTVAKVKQNTGKQINLFHILLHPSIQSMRRILQSSELMTPTYLNQHVTIVTITSILWL